MNFANHQIESAAHTLGGEFTNLDPGTIAVTLGGFGFGLFSAEFAAEFAGGNIQKPRTRVAVELLTKLGLGAGELYGGMQMSGLLAVILLFAGVGTLSSFALDVTTVVINTLQGQGVSASGMADNVFSESHTGNASLDASGTANSGQNATGTESAGTVAADAFGGNPAATA